MSSPSVFVTPDPSGTLMTLQVSVDKDGPVSVIVVRQPWFNKNFTPEEAAVMWHGGVGQAWREEVSVYYSFEIFSALMAALDARASAIARALDVEQLDLMPILEPSLRTYYDAFHITDDGALQIADAVTASILRLPQPRRQDAPVALKAS